MKTYVLHVRDTAASADYAVELVHWVAPGDDRNAIVATDTIPRDLRPEDFDEPLSDLLKNFETFLPGVGAEWHMGWKMALGEERAWDMSKKLARRIGNYEPDVA